jgi:hypothetical protein
MVKRGFAMADRRFLREFDDAKDFCTFEQTARTADLGIWKLPVKERIAGWEWRQDERTRFTDYGTATAAGCNAAIGKSIAQQPKFEPLPQFDWRGASSDPRCRAKRTCDEMRDCEEAKFYLQTCGLRLDRDGVAWRAISCAAEDHLLADHLVVGAGCFWPCAAQ